MLDDNNVCDWSKLDGIIAGIGKPFAGMISMFGTFDFNNVVGSSQASQKERRVRRKAGLAAEKRPTAVTEDEAGTSESGSSKVEIVHKAIKDVCKM